MKNDRNFWKVTRSMLVTLSIAVASAVSVQIAGQGLFASKLIAAEAEIKTVEYKIGGKTFEGFFLPGQNPKKVQGKQPVIVMVHNWMGVTEETKTQAKRFAQLGYSVFGADIYGKGVRPKNQQEAGQLAGQYKGNRKLFREHLNGALAAALTQKNVDANQVVVAGYCFGGTAAIEFARSGANLKGVISFHGGLDSPTPADGKNIKSSLLVLHGADDPFVPKADIQAFEAEMKASQVKYQMIQYPGAVHSFTEKAAGNDNSKGAAYNKDADEKSFQEAKKYLAGQFSK